MAHEDENFDPKVHVTARKDETIFHSETHPAPEAVIKQELITWEKSEYGLVKKTLTRCFLPNRHCDSFVSEPIVLTPAISSETDSGKRSE